MRTEIKDDEPGFKDMVQGWWDEAAKVSTLDQARDLGRHLLDDYEHTYGSACIAAAVASYATFMACAGEEGLTGFQAKYANLLIFDRIAFGKRMDLAEAAGAPLSRHIFYDDMLTPVGMDSIRTYSQRVKDWLRSEAKARLQDAENLDSATKAHLRKLAAGNYPKWMKFEDAVYIRDDDE